jgi:putative spermidine/putrescine transport system permease protein
MLTELVRPRQRPVMNVVAVFVIVVTFAPLVFAQLLARRAEGASESSLRRLRLADQSAPD